MFPVPHKPRIIRLDNWLLGLTQTQQWALSIIFVEVVLIAMLILRRLLGFHWS